MCINKIYTLLCALCLVSCSEKIETIINEEGHHGLSFSIGISSTSISNEINTKTTTDSKFKTTFDNDDEIGMFIYKRSKGEEPSVDESHLYVKNVKLTLNNGNWELENPIYYPDSETLLDIYAYYPYKENTNITALEYDAHEEMNELLMVSTLGMKKSITSINLKFQHILSLTHITLVKDSNVPDFDENMNVYFNGVIGGKYNIVTQELTEPVTGIIKMDLAGEAGKETRGYIAYIPEQETATGILFSIFQMTSNKEILSSKDIDQVETFTRGEVRLFYIRIKQEIEKDITYDVYDLYPKYGTPVGMVIEVYNGGRNGKVISLKDTDSVAWAITEAMSYTTDATDFNDGITNKMKIQSLDNWEENYPAFKACIMYGERWYLPGIGEMQWFMTDNTVGNDYRLSAINDRLRNHSTARPELGIELIGWEASYFSSTESNDPEKAVKLYIGRPYATKDEPKDWRYPVRPFYEF